MLFRSTTQPMSGGFTRWRKKFCCLLRNTGIKKIEYGTFLRPSLIGALDPLTVEWT